MLRSMKRTGCDKGFSLVELIVVIAIMAILVGVAVPVYSMYIEKSQINSDKTTVNSIIRAMEIAGKGGTFSFADVEQAGTNGLQIPLGFIMITNEPDSNGNYVQILKTDDETVNANAATIEKILTEAYGTDYAKELKLQSDTWTDSTIPTLFSQADELFGKVQGLSDLLYKISPYVLKLLGVTVGSYTSKDDLVVTLAEKVVALDQNTFVEDWKSVADDPKGKNATFGLPSQTSEFYAAARRAYNESFASYVTANGHGTHANAIATCGQGAPSIDSNLVMPKAICWDLFNNDGANSSYILPDGFLKSDVEMCQTCRTLYKKYCDSEVCEQNAIAFYKSMATIAETGRDDDGNANLSNYTDYVNSFSALYSTVEAESAKYESVVVLTLYLQNGIVVTDASPMHILEN